MSKERMEEIKGGGLGAFRAFKEWVDAVSELISEIERLQEENAKYYEYSNKLERQINEYAGVEKSLKSQIEELEKEKNLIKEINEWQDKTFPDANPYSIFSHMVKEFVELRDNINDPMEQADIFILLVGLAHNTNVNLMQAVKEKLEINKNRTWGKPDENGVIEHIDPR